LSVGALAAASLLRVTDGGMLVLENLEAIDEPLVAQRKGEFHDLRDDRGGAPSHGIAEKFLGRRIIEHVRVAVDEAGNERSSCSIDHSCARPNRVVRLRPHISDPFSFRGDGAAFENLTGVDIDQVDSFDDQIRFLFAEGYGGKGSHSFRTESFDHGSPPFFSRPRLYLKST